MGDNMDNSTLRARIAAEPRGQFNRYAPWVIAACRKVYLDVLNLEKTAEITGVSATTLGEWLRYGYGGAWFEPPRALVSPQRSRVVMPEDAGKCLVIAAELLWLARNRRP